MSRRCYEQRILATPFRLDNKWHDLTGSEMPAEISAMPIPDIERRIALLEDKNTVCGIPRKPVAVVETASDSLEDWDRQGMKNGNAYGS